MAAATPFPEVGLDDALDAALAGGHAEAEAVGLDASAWGIPASVAAPWEGTICSFVNAPAHLAYSMCASHRGLIPLPLNCRGRSAYMPISNIRATR